MSDTDGVRHRFAAPLRSPGGDDGVLIRIRDLKQLSRAELRDAIVDAWLTRAPKRIAKAWLAENEG